MAPVPVGLIGLGNMGGALLARLLASGPVLGFDIDAPRRASASRAGAGVVQSVAQLASDCSILILSLPRPEISRAVLAQVLAVPREGRLIIETSTITS